MNARLAILLVTVPLAWSCASGAGQPGRLGTPRHDPNIITVEELAGVNAGSLYDAIVILRPQWMGQNCDYSWGRCTPLVYMGRTLLGSPDMLRQLTVAAARELRWYGLHEAQAEFGLSASANVIQVVSRRGQ